jgi:hypothetical protein
MLVGLERRSRSRAPTLALPTSKLGWTPHLIKGLHWFGNFFKRNSQLCLRKTVSSLEQSRELFRTWRKALQFGFWEVIRYCMSSSLKLCYRFCLRNCARVSGNRRQEKSLIKWRVIVVVRMLLLRMPREVVST